jgi:3-oxoacyl-[acyl-carrier protein] reductase
MPPVSNRIVWITGAGSGIGHALAVEYANKAFTTIVSGRNDASLNRLRKTINDKGGNAHCFVCDVRNAESVNAVAQKIIGSIGIPDILVNNAGITVFKEFIETSVEEFDDIMSTNLRGSFLTTKAILPSMIKRKNGIVLNIVSFAAKTTYTASSAYAASKAGLAAMMDGLRTEVRSHGIKIVNVFPGAVLTPIWSSKVRTKYGNTMLTTQDAARMICSVSCQPQSLMVEELVIRPQIGDINA